MPHLLFKNRFVQFSILFIGLLPWLVYALTIHIGLDSLVDEGLTLLLVNPYETPNYLGSQFGYLGKYIFIYFGYTAITSLWARYVIECVSVLMLLSTSFLFLNNRYNLKINSKVYAGFVLLISSLCLYLFTKTLSYNHLQQFFILALVSFYLLYNTFQNREGVKTISLLGLGMVSFFAIINIIPSGLLVTSVTLLALILKNRSSLKLVIKTLAVFALGSILGILIFHFFINSVFNLVDDLYSMLFTVSKLNRAYDKFSLFFNLFRSALCLFTVYALSIGVLNTFDFTANKLNRRFWAYLVSLIGFLTVIIYTTKYTTIVPLTVSEWSFAPLVLALFICARRMNLRLYLTDKKLIILFLMLIPFVSPFGTNLFITYKFGYYFLTWLIVIFLLGNYLDETYTILVASLATLLAIYWNVQGFVYIQRKIDQATVISTQLDRLAHVYITPKQKEHFENLSGVLKRHGFSKGDTILAFQPDLMSVFAVAGVSGKRAYFVPNDYLQEETRFTKPPKFIILNEYSYSQLDVSLRKWGFPQKYTKINIGSPETANYFDADKPRMLFCLK